jgi:hypothetical protein
MHIHMYPIVKRDLYNKQYHKERHQHDRSQDQQQQRQQQVELLFNGQGPGDKKRSLAARFEPVGTIHNVTGEIVCKQCLVFRGIDLCNVHESRLDQQYQVIKRPQAQDSSRKKTTHVDDTRLAEFPKHQGHDDVSAYYEKKRHSVTSMGLKPRDPVHRRGRHVVKQHEEYS